MATLPDESWSTQEVFEKLCAEATSGVEDDEAYHAHVRLLQQRDPAEVWRLVVPLATSTTPELQSLVPDVLRYLSGPDRPDSASRIDETVALFRAMLARDPAPGVIARIGLAFIDLGGESGLEIMLPFVGHADARVRAAVVHALLGLMDDRAIEALIRLSRDEQGSIRDWATFGLGTLLANPAEDTFLDSPSIREALAARLDDPHEDTRAEAVVGLAARGDRRALPVVLEALNGETFQMLYLDAARDLADPSLCVPLRRIAAEVRFDDGERERLEEALAACCGQKS